MQPWLIQTNYGDFTVAANYSLAYIYSNTGAPSDIDPVNTGTLVTGPNKIYLGPPKSGYVLYTRLVTADDLSDVVETSISAKRDIPFPASAASVTALGSITAGSGFKVLPVIAPSGGTLTAGVSPADPCEVIATSLKCVTATVLAAGTGVAINDTFNPTGGTLAAAGPYGNCTLTAGVKTLLTVTHTKVVSAVVNAGGTGGTPGAVTVTGTTGTGTKFQATGTINGSGVLTGPLTVTVAGDYTANPSDISAEPVTGGSLSGATVTVVMGALTLAITTVGGYTIAPAYSNTLTKVSGNSSGVQATLSYGVGTASIIHSGNYSGAPSWTVTPTDGNGTGASIASGTLGGNGAAIIRKVPNVTQVANYGAFVQFNNQAGNSYIHYKSLTHTSVALYSSTTLSAGTFDLQQ